MEETGKMKQQIAQLQDKLARQEKLASLGVLSAGIAHEIQNPLNFVINFSKLSAKLIDELQEIILDNKDKFSDDDVDDLTDISNDLKENMTKILEHGERATSIIRGILLQSRGKAGEFLPTDVAQLVHEYVNLSYHAMRANDKSFNITIQEEYQEGMPKLMLIPQDISRAVLNVMNNACYAVKLRSEMESADYKPTVAVKVALTDNTLQISIADNGVGMSKEVQDKLYENFFTTKPAGQGTGLGMGIVRNLIEDNHNGKVVVDSAENVGTTLTFIIPEVKIVK